MLACMFDHTMPCMFDRSPCCLRTVQGVLYYQIEYTVEGPRFQRHNVSVIASVGESLYTLNVQCPISKWPHDGTALQQAAASFQLLR